MGEERTPLSDNEMRFAALLKRRQLQLAIGATLASVLAIALFGVRWGLRIAHQPHATGILGPVLIALFVIIGLLVWRFAWRIVWRLRRDGLVAEKAGLRGRIDKLRRRERGENATTRVRMGELKLTAKTDCFKPFKVGDEVDVTFLPHSYIALSAHRPND